MFELVSVTEDCSDQKFTTSWVMYDLLHQTFLASVALCTLSKFLSAFLSALVREFSLQLNTDEFFSSTVCVDATTCHFSFSYFFFADDGGPNEAHDEVTQHSGRNTNDQAHTDPTKVSCSSRHSHIPRQLSAPSAIDGHVIVSSVHRRRLSCLCCIPSDRQCSLKQAASFFFGLRFVGADAVRYISLIEEMQRNLDEAHNSSYEVEWKLDRVLWEYIEPFEKERGRPQLIMTSSGR